VVGTFREPSGGRRVSPIHSIHYSVAQPLERGFINYYSIIQGDFLVSKDFYSHQQSWWLFFAKATK
jgi:hypothetical protein